MIFPFVRSRILEHRQGAEMSDKTVSTFYRGLVCAMCALAVPVAAQETYPSAAPIRLVVGFGAGGASDLIARMLAQSLTAQMGGSVIVDNRAGANGNIAAEQVAKSKPDGYTLLFITPNQILSPAFGEKLAYDVLRDLAPVAPLTSTPHLLLAYAGVPANTPAEFIAYVKANPDKLAYGSAGTGRR